MRTPIRRIATILLALGAPLAHAQSEPTRIPVHLFTQLPADIRHPESLATDPATGAIYVGTFDARTPAPARNNHVLRLAPDGTEQARWPAGPHPLTGLAFAADHLYFLDFATATLRRLPADFTADSAAHDVATFTALAPPSPGERRIANPDGSDDRIRFGSAGIPAPNGLLIDATGTAYISDSFQGAIYRIADIATCTAPCRVDVVAHDPLLATTGALPFGANGIAIDPARTHLYVNNAGDHRVLRVPLDGSPITVLAEQIHGADGLQLHDGLLWVSANQADAVIALDLHGRERHRAGQFLGIDADGAPRGLLFPAATTVSGQRMIVANLALPLTPATGDEWEESITRWNLMQFDLPPPHP